MAGSIEGIISGFNTSEIINTIIKYESRRIELVAASQAESTNKLTTWKSIEALLVGVKSEASLLSSKNLWEAKSVSSSNEDIISVSASTGAVPGHYFMRVDQLATNHQIASQGISSLSQNFGTGTFEIQIGDNSPTVITVDSSNNTLTTLKDAINNSSAPVTAAIINDGSEFNPYRLLITAEESGENSEITITSNLTGTEVPQFSADFDLVEKLNWSNDATANAILSTAAAYTGAQNKTYTFTVGGTGLQTIGSGDIELNWTDGTNSGTITVSAADTDIELTGDGADGLQVYFSAGALNAGDTFQVQAFAPTIQSGQDAILRLGSDSNGGSPILFHSASNTLKDLIEGVTLNLNSISDGEEVEISIEEDRSKIKDQIRKFVSTYNEYQKFVDDQFSFDPEADTESGILMGDTALMLIHNNVRTTITGAVNGLPEGMRMFSQAGIKFNTLGKLSFDEATFDEQVEENFTQLRNLFKSSGTTDHTKIEYVSAGANTEISTAGYDVDITQVATRGSLTGASIANPSVSPLILTSTNNTIKLKVNNLISDDIQLDEGNYSSGADLAEEIEDKLNGSDSLSGYGVEVEWVDNGDNGHLVVYSSTYGENSIIEIETEPSNSAHDILGFTAGTSAEGLNVEGTINGEAATGSGQYLTGDSDNETTAGLKLLITLEETDLVEGAEGKVSFIKGVADIIEDKINGYTDPYEGSLQSRKKALESQIEGYADRITFLEKQIESKRVSLYKQFNDMEQAMAQIQAEQQYLTSAIASLSQLRTGLTSSSS